MTKDEIKEYRSYINGYDMTDDEKDEMLMFIWHVVGNVVDQAYGINPMQECQKNM